MLPQRYRPVKGPFCEENALMVKPSARDATTYCLSQVVSTQIVGRASLLLLRLLDLSGKLAGRDHVLHCTDDYSHDRVLVKPQFP